MLTRGSLALSIALIFPIQGAACAEHICVDWIDSLGPCSAHDGCNLATYKCKGKDGASGCGRTYTTHVPDLERWPSKGRSTATVCKAEAEAYGRAVADHREAAKRCEADSIFSEACKEARKKYDEMVEAKKALDKCTK